MEWELRPRLCFLTKGPRGYGFHLHGERNKGGQFIRKVEPGSSAELSGLRAGDRLVEVNGENVEDETHHQVVYRIRAVEHRTRLLVIDKETDDYLRGHGLACTEDLAVEMGNLSPRPSPFTSPSASPVAQGEVLSPSPIHILTKALKHTSASPRRMDTRSPTSSLMIGTKKRLPSETASLDTEFPMATVELLPRLCHMVKGELGYGFNLHSDRTRRGQFIRSVDPGSPAQHADLRPRDRLVEVNGVNIEALRHSEVVSFIRGGGDEACLLVVDAETDELFKRLGVTPTSTHVKEVYVDEPMTDSAPPTPSSTTDLPPMDPPIINVTLMGSPITNGSPNSQTNGSSASQYSRGSTTQSEFSSSDMSIQVPEDYERRVSDPFLDSGLHLSPTAAEAKERAQHGKKRAPPMDWSKKQEIFSNF
ncbi:Na(+)/H(+) exchange regulatory cofactor NHE-RF2 [Salmo trutta]|uniref:Na(+)/H(+) exchange regulatory cofactor NHE-RF2 n=1 Tax=Salmo trutta TaxID=8032 RepID=UPI00113148B3|nr:Na(+)/H(+) exchange regulatory cofactor NHE-RF2-like [Salmo trutta]